MALSVTSEVRKPHLDGKNGIDVNTVSAHFKLQALANTCYTTCIFNVLNDLADSHDSPAIGFPEHKVNKLCGYKQNFGPKLAIVVPNLNRELKRFGYSAHERTPTTHDGLMKALEDHESSYPVIGLSYPYLVDQNAVEPLDIPNPPDHTVIVLSSGLTETVVFDTYDARSRSLQQNPNRIGRGLYVMPTTKLIEYWERAGFSSWMFWVHRDSKEGARLLRLEQYDGNMRERNS